MQIGNNQYNAKVIIGFTSGNNMLLYDLINLTPDSFKVKIKKADTHTVQQSKSTENDRTRVSADIRLPRNNKSVNEKFSVDEDTDEKAGAIHDTLKFSIDENKSKWLVNDDGKSVFDAVKDEKNPRQANQHFISLCRQNRRTRNERGQGYTNRLIRHVC